MILVGTMAVEPSAELALKESCAMSGWIVIIVLCAGALLVVWATVIYERRRCRASTGRFSVQVLVKEKTSAALKNGKR